MKSARDKQTGRYYVRYLSDSNGWNERRYLEQVTLPRYLRATQVGLLPNGGLR